MTIIINPSDIRIGPWLDDDEEVRGRRIPSNKITRTTTTRTEHQHIHPKAHKFYRTSLHCPFVHSEQKQIEISDNMLNMIMMMMRWWCIDWMLSTHWKLVAVVWTWTVHCSVSPASQPFNSARSLTDNRIPYCRWWWSWVFINLNHHHAPSIWSTICWLMMRHKWLSIHHPLFARPPTTRGNKCNYSFRCPEHIVVGIWTEIYL